MSCTLPFTMQTQSQTEWCWAAAATSVSLFYSTASTWTQCKLANKELGQTTCCVNGKTPKCNQPWYLEDALKRVGHLHSFSSGSISLTKCDAQVCTQQQPVGVRIDWGGGKGHFAVIAGVDTVSSLLTVHDSFYGTSYISHTTLQTSYQGTGTWSHTYLTQ